MFSPQADTADILEMSAMMAGIGRPSSSPSSSPAPLNTGRSDTAGLPDDAYEEDMEQCPPPSPPLPTFPDQDFTAVPDVPLPPPPPDFLTPLETPQEQQVPEQAQAVSTSTSPLPHLPPPPSPPPPPPPSPQSLPPPSSSPPPSPPPPAANNLPLGIVMECPPALQPVPAIPEASLRQDSVAPRPPTVDRTGKPLPKQPQAMPSGDVKLMKWGSWPLLSPGRRDWFNSSLQIAVPRSRITWPPKNWQVMSRQQRTSALQVVAPMVSMGDEEPGNCPLKSPEALMEEFNMLALPGTGTNHGHDPVGLAQRQLHSALKHSSRTDPKAHQGMLNLLQQGRAAGPRARNDLLRQVNLHNVPVVPYHKGQRQETVPAYSPSQPGLEEWCNVGVKKCSLVVSIVCIVSGLQPAASLLFICTVSGLQPAASESPSLNVLCRASSPPPLSLHCCLYCVGPPARRLFIVYVLCQVSSLPPLHWMYCVGPPARRLWVSIVCIVSGLEPTASESPLCVLCRASSPPPRHWLCV